MAQAESRREELRHRIKDRAGKTHILLAVFAFASALYTYHGVAEQLTETGDSWYEKSLAMVFAATVGVFIYLTWSYVFGFLGLLHPVTRQRQGMALAAIMVAAIVAISSFFNAIALFGGSARQRALDDGLAAYEMRLDAANNQLRSAKRLLPAINAQINALRIAVDGENKGGLTGSKGYGQAANVAEQAMGAVTGLRETIASAIDGAQPVLDQALAQLDVMRRQVYQRGPLRPREEAFRQAAAQIERLRAQLSEGHLLATIRQASQTLDQVIIRPAPSNGPLGHKQAQVADSVQQTLRAFGAQLQSAIGDIEAVAPPKPVKIRPLSSAEAVLVYWRDFVPNWIAAIIIDACPAFLAAFLMLAEASAADNRAARDTQAPKPSGRKPSANARKKDLKS